MPRPYLTRFNKIAIQGTPQMAVDKEALICLSRVYTYYFKCNFPLFYVYPALTRYLSILFLNILTLLACTHSSDQYQYIVGRPRRLAPGIARFITLRVMLFASRLWTCPNQRISLSIVLSTHVGRTAPKDSPPQFSFLSGLGWG